MDTHMLLADRVYTDQGRRKTRLEIMTYCRLSPSGNVIATWRPFKKLSQGDPQSPGTWAVKLAQHLSQKSGDRTIRLAAVEWDFATKAWVQPATDEAPSYDTSRKNPRRQIKTGHSPHVQVF